MLHRKGQRAIFGNFSSESGLPGTLQVAGHFLPVKYGSLSVRASAFICQYYLDCRHYLDGILIVPAKFVIAATIYAFFNYGFGLGLLKGILPFKK